MSSLQSPANPLCQPEVHWLRLPQTHLPVKLTTVMVHSSIPCPGPSHSQHSPLFFHHSPINPLWLKNSLTWYSSNQLHFKIITEILAFPRWRKRCGFDLWVRKIPWSRKWQPTPALVPGESQGQRSLMGYSPWGCRVRRNWACTSH